MTTGIIHRIPTVTRFLARIGMASMTFPDTPKPPASGGSSDQRYVMPLETARQYAALLAAHVQLTPADRERLTDVESAIAALDHANDLLISPDVAGRLLAAITADLDDLWRRYGDTGEATGNSSPMSVASRPAR